MADYLIYYFFHIVPLLVLVCIPMYFIVNLLRWGVEMMEKMFKH